MAWTKKFKFTRPNTDVDFYKAAGAGEAITGQLNNSDQSYLKLTYFDTGKLISISTSLSDNQLELIKTMVYKDEASKDEHISDSVTQDFVGDMIEYNTTNNILIAIIQDEAT
jgi:hypothetical protein